MHEHDSCLSPPLKPHDLRKEENISLKNANVVHLVHINSMHEHCIFHFKKKKKKNEAWKWCALFAGNTGSLICSSVVRSMCYQWTGDIIIGLILFLLMICEIWKIADLWGFHGISEGILNLTNCTVYDSPLEGHSKVSNSCLTTLFYRAFAWPDVFANICSTFHLAFFPEVVSLCLQSSQG